MFARAVFLQRGIIALLVLVASGWARLARGAPGITPASTVSGPTLSASSPSSAAAAKRLPVIGVGADVGLPDGAMASFVLRPVSVLRLALGVGSNSSAPGFRAGMSVLPWGAGPSLTFEAGHYLAGSADGPIKTFFGGIGRFASYVGKLDYTFVNGHAGLDLGTRNFTFFAHAGVSYMRATLRDVVIPPDPAMRADAPATRLTFREDPVLRMLTPSVKLGIVFYLQ